MSGLIVGLVLRQPITEKFNSDAKFSLRRFRTAAEAEGYGACVILRWMRLYDAALLAMVGDETVTVNVEPTA